jgi:hypothetical protein
MPLDAGWAHKAGRGFIRVRELSPLGRYPNAEVACHRSAYRIHRGRPYVVSEISPTEEAKWSYGSELADWSRQEVRMASAVSSVEWGGFIAYMTSGAFDVPHAVLRQVATADRWDLALECAALLAEAWDRSPSSRHRHAQMTAPLFRISNPLLLRTAGHYLKASMLWATDGFREEALASLMFALEGCLLLFQELEGAQTARLDRTLLSEIFRRTYCYGDATMHFVEEGIGWGANRAQMIHPQLADQNGWKPLIFGDDYYGFDKLVRALLTYLMTGRSFDDYELAATASSIDPEDAGIEAKG